MSSGRGFLNQLVPPDWAPVQAQPEGLVFLEEAPPSPSETLDLFGQNAALQTLQEALIGALHSTQSDCVEGHIFALFGRFGQGKTRVLKCLEHWLDGKSTEMNGWLFPRRVQVFKVSEYSQQTVAAAFDAFLGRDRIFVRSAFGLCLAFTLAALASACVIGASSVLREIISFEGSDNITEFGVVRGVFAITFTAALTVLSGVSVLRFWKNEAERYINLADVAAFLRLLRDTFQRGDVLLIDDFDRATIDQQVEMLWTLRRRRENLRMIVVLAFDESPLLRGADGVSAQELLEKTFDMAVRLNPITRQDAIRLATGFSQRLGERNPRSPAAQLLCDPLIVADLARVYMLLGRASARFAKGFVNRLLAAAHQLRVQISDDLSALARLQGLYELIPWLESDAELLGDLLSSNDTDALLSHVDRRQGSALENHVREKVRRYIEGTARLQPGLGNWDRVLALWIRAGNLKQGDFVAPFGFEPSARFYDEWLGNSYAYRTEFVSRWLSWDLALLAESQPLERRTMYKICRRRVGQWVDPAFTVLGGQYFEGASRLVPTSVEHLLWLYFLDRTRMADRELSPHEMLSLAFPADEILADLSETAREEAVSAWRRLPLVHVHVPLSLPERVELASFALPERGMGPAIARLFHQVRDSPLDTFCIPADVRVFGLRFSGVKNLERRSYLERYWPAFDDDGAEGHFRAVAVLAPWRPIAPRAHRLWLFEKAERNQADAILLALGVLLPKPLAGVETQHWPLEVVRPLLVRRAGDEFRESDYRRLASVMASGIDVSDKRNVEKHLFLLSNTEEWKSIEALLTRGPPNSFDLNWLRTLGSLRGESPTFASLFDRSDWRIALDRFLDCALADADSEAKTSIDLNVVLLRRDNIDAIRCLWLPLRSDGRRRRRRH